MVEELLRWERRDDEVEPPAARLTHTRSCCGISRARESIREALSNKDGLAKP